MKAMHASIWRLVRKAHLGVAVVAVYLDVTMRLHRTPLPVLVSRLAHPPTRLRQSRDVRRLSRAVDRSLRLGRRQPTCLVTALVLFRLLRAQGQPAELVVGLPAHPSSKDAHAWVELHGRDLGPPPGRSGHQEIARYPTHGGLTVVGRGLTR